MDPPQQPELASHVTEAGIVLHFRGEPGRGGKQGDLELGRRSHWPQPIRICSEEQVENWGFLAWVGRARIGPALRFHLDFTFVSSRFHKAGRGSAP